MDEAFFAGCPLFLVALKGSGHIGGSHPFLSGTNSQTIQQFHVFLFWERGTPLESITRKVSCFFGPNWAASTFKWVVYWTP